MELVVVVRNFPVRCHGLDVALLLEPWLLAGGPYHGTRRSFFRSPNGSGMYLGQLSTLKMLTTFRNVSHTVSFGLSYCTRGIIYFRIIGLSMRVR